METVSDFEDMLECLEKHEVRYLIVGGLAFIYHAKPRFTKDIDVWVGPNRENIGAANRALADFGSPTLLDQGVENQVLQIGVAPDRIDVMVNVEAVDFEEAWDKRVRGNYGKVKANWMDLDSLIRVKASIDDPRHREDVRILREVKRRRTASEE